MKLSIDRDTLPVSLLSAGALVALAWCSPAEVFGFVKRVSSQRSNEVIFVFSAEMFVFIRRSAWRRLLFFPVFIINHHQDIEHPPESEAPPGPD